MKRTTVVLDDTTWHRIKLLCKQSHVKQVDLFRMIVDKHFDEVEGRLRKVDEVDYEVKNIISYLEVAVDRIRSIK